MKNIDAGVIDKLLRHARGFVSFAPRSLFMIGLRPNDAWHYCEWLAKVGKLRPFRLGGETWYRVTVITKSNPQRKPSDNVREM